LNTEVIKIDPIKIDEEKLKKAAQILKNGGVVAFPTETVYGLGADALRREASKKIYAAKGRPSDNPLIVHVSKEEEVYKLCNNINDNTKALMKKFWPGPLTIILQKKEILPVETTGGLNTVGVRMPNHSVALKLIELSGCPLAAPSANTSGRPSPTRAEHVIEDMLGKIDMIIDAGVVGIGIESTIVDMTEDVPVILRPGAITKEMLEEVLGEVLVDSVVVAKSKEDIENLDSAPKAPGMKYRHYAPKAELTMYEGEEEAVVKKINEMVLEAVNKGMKPGVICTEETKNRYRDAVVVPIGSRSDESSIAHNLYNVLRDFDNMDIDIIFSETFFKDGLSVAIMNRLIKAAGYKVEKTL